MLMGSKTRDFRNGTLKAISLKFEEIPRRFITLLFGQVNLTFEEKLNFNL